MITLSQFNIVRTLDEIRKWLKDHNTDTSHMDDQEVVHLAVMVAQGSGKAVGEVLKFANWLKGY